MKLYNFEEYDQPNLYDTENENYKEDLPFLLKWAERCKGPIIDLACGTGRATIPLAIVGHTIIGVDIHKGMLDLAKQKAEVLNLDIDWVQQDCTELDLHLKSELIFSVGNSFQHFLTNEQQDALLSSVHRHLATGGYFIFETRFPNAEELLQPTTEEYWRTYKNQLTGKSVDVYTISQYDSLNQLQHYTTIRKEDGQQDISTSITLRYVFPKEMQRLLNSHGFDIVHIYKDWNERFITKDSVQMVYVCRKSEDSSER